MEFDDLLIEFNYTFNKTFKNFMHVQVKFALNLHHFDQKTSPALSTSSNSKSDNFTKQLVQLIQSLEKLHF